MKVAHQHLNITEREWQATLAEFKKRLAEFSVSSEKQQELIDFVAGTGTTNQAAATEGGGRPPGSHRVGGTLQPG